MNSYYTDLPFMAGSSCSYCTDLPFMWIRLIRQQFMVNCSSSGRCSSAHFTSSDAADDRFIKLQFEKFTQTVAETVLKFLLLSDLIELICLRLHASLIFAIFPRSASISWHMLTKFQQGRQSRVGQSFAIE